MEMQLGALAAPLWAGSAEKRGLDPLGMQGESIGLYQSLLPGLGNVTLRMRYYGLYAWLAQKYAQNVGNENPEEWRHFLRRGEALYALIAVAVDDAAGIAGSEWARRVLDAANGGDISLKTESRASPQHLQQSFGAFGAAYGSPLYDLDVLRLQKKSRIPVPSPGLGVRLADSFERAAGSSASTFSKAIQSRHVSTATLTSMASLSPSRIEHDSAERQCYEDILFKTGQSERHAARRDTLLLLLEVANQVAALPDVLTFRWAMYGGRLPDGTQLSTKNPGLQKRQEDWWLYHANDLTHVVLEALLAYLLELIETRFTDGVTIETLMRLAIDNIVPTLPDAVQTWKDFAAHVVTGEIVSHVDPKRERSLTESLLQGRRSSKGDSIVTYARDALRLLALLEHQSTSRKEVIARRFGKLNVAVSRSLCSELEFLAKHAEHPITEMLSTLLTERVLRRHLWVAVQKLRYQNAYTFLVDLDNGRLRLRKKDGPVFTNPRLSPAITFLRDIHLLSDKGITPRGHAVLDTTT
ncbi:hypothetical protein [Paraburkholderia terrae]|uniref:Uncharacterized protein n=1 Tax=Paraburkholderia terrae TaxID=311230 RepID=A0A2I8EZR1_9BURK|nr:hypothetical protein [Paraburkholderia terrae]AUT64958.1 hypothetical protein C2L65_35745 [Paraburkholderia terrae]